MKTVHEVAKLTGISVRTLHHYDKIGLLPPTKKSSAGYRLYDEQSLELLEQILFFKELEIPLREIKLILQSPSFDKRHALLKQKQLLIKKRKRLDDVIAAIDKKLMGDEEVNFQVFDTNEFETMRKEYAEEVREKYVGSIEYAQYEARERSYDKEAWEKILGEQNRLFAQFTSCMDKGAESSEALRAAKDWQRHITKYYYDCTDEILNALADMYTADERFSKNLDGKQKGLAEFMHDAIKNYLKTK